MGLIIQFCREMALRLSGFNSKFKKIDGGPTPCPVNCRVAGHCLSLENCVTAIFFSPMTCLKCLLDNHNQPLQIIK